MRTRGVLRVVVATALTLSVARSEFASLRADASLCNVDDCFDFKLVLANFGVFPYGQYLEFDDFRIWQPEEDPDYPSTCGVGPTSFCQFSCVPEAFETDAGMLTLAPRSAIGVLRSLGGQANEAECSFFTKVQVAQTTQAEAVIVINERDDDAITMDTTKANGELTLDVQTKPAFMMERRYVAEVKEFLNATAGDTMRMTIDLRNLFPQHTKLDITMWGSRLWSCASHSATEQDCRRRVELMESSQFSDQMESFLRQDEARIFVRQPSVDVCRKQDDSPVDPEFQAFCNNTQLVQTHCIHAGRYCQPQDPYGSSRGTSGGREALIETLRCKCVQEVSQNFNEAQFYFAYMKAWDNVCLPQSDFSNECSLESFNEAAISQWSQEALTMANTTREEIQQTLASCVEMNTANLDEDVPNALFEEDARLDDSVFIDPTITVNGEQIRGAYIAENMLPAICSAFGDGSEPESCLKYSTNLCDVGGDAYNECRSGYFAGAGRTNCKNEFGSFKCQCESNQRRMEYEPTPEEKALFPDLSSTEFFRCVDENQCIDTRTCPADRICLNKGNAHECMLKEEACTEENAWGGCYVSELRPAGNEDGPPLTACVSRISELRALAASGDASVQTEAPFNCSCAALPCHRGNGLACEQLCPLEECLNRENPAISTCILAADSRGVGIGPISSGGVLGIVAAAFMLLTIAGLLFAMRYQKQNRDRLIDLSALVRGFTMGSDGTPRHQHGSYTPRGRLMATATPSSLYHNAAFQHRTRDTDTAAFLPGPDSRGPSSTGTAGPMGPTSGPSGPTGPGHSGGTGGLSGERFRPFGNVIDRGRRESPPARRTIRPPPPGHIPQQIPPDDDPMLPPSAYIRGPQREIVIGPRPLAEDRSTSVPSREGSLRALDAFGSISEVMRTWSSRKFRRSHSHSTSHTNTNSNNSRSGSVTASVTPSSASVRSGRVSAALHDHNNSAERVEAHSSGYVHEQELQEFGDRTDSESFRVVDEVLRRSGEDADTGDPPAGAALNLDTSRFADVTLHSTTDINRAMHTMEKSMISDEGMSSFAAVTASSGGLPQSPEACVAHANTNASANAPTTGGQGVSTRAPNGHNDSNSHPEGMYRPSRASGVQACADAGVDDIATPDISEGNEGEPGGTMGWVKQEPQGRNSSRTGSEDRERTREEPVQQDQEAGSAMTRALKEVPSENSTAICNTMNGVGDSIQNHMWGTLGSSAFGAALGDQSASVNSGCLLQETRGRYTRHHRVPDISIHAECLVEESSRLSGDCSGATSGSGGSKDRTEDGAGRGTGTSSTLLVDTPSPVADTPSPVAPEDRRVGPFMDAEDLLSTSELFSSQRNVTANELLGSQQHNRQHGVGRSIHSSSLRTSHRSYSAVHSRPVRAAVASVSSAAGSTTVSSGTSGSGSGCAQATIASRVDPAPLVDSAALGTSSILGSIQSSSFDVIKRIQMMLPGWRSTEDTSSYDEMTRSAGAAVGGEGDSRKSGASDVHASISLGRCPSLQLSQLQECPDSEFDAMNTCEQFV